MLVASFPTDDAAPRVADLVRTMTPACQSDEALIRTGERVPDASVHAAAVAAGWASASHRRVSR